MVFRFRIVPTVRVSPTSLTSDPLAVSAFRRSGLETRTRGFFPAVLSSLRHMLSGTQEAAHRRFAALGVPVVAIWGEEDGVIPITAMGRLAEWNRQAAQEVVAGAGHGLPYTHAAEVVDLIKGILRE